MPYPMSPEEKAINKAVGSLMREARLKAKITQDGMAARLRVHSRTIGNMERGDHRISVSKVIRYANILGTNPGDLLGVYTNQAR